MDKELLQERTALTRDELKELLGAEGICLSILIPMERVPGQTKQNGVRLRNAISTAERQLAERGVNEAGVRELLQPIRDFAADPEQVGTAGAGLILWRAEGVFRDVRLAQTVREAVVTGDHFEIRPALRELDASQVFYILALARGDIRLLRCTDHSSEVVELPRGTPKSVDERLQTDKPDHDLKNSAAAGPSSGSSKGVMFGTGSDAEAHDEYWHQFYRAVDKGVTEVLKKDLGAPLVLVGVEKELALYHKITEYDWTIPGGVHGAPDGLKGGEMHKRALEHLRSQVDPNLERALNLYERSVGVARTSHQINQCVKAAYEGRVSHLFLADGATQMGSFDEATQRARQHGTPQPGDEDLLNAAAAETIKNGGQVFVIAKEQVPNNSVIAAVLRY
jgi:hypothetical protein